MLKSEATGRLLPSAILTIMNLTALKVVNIITFRCYYQGLLVLMLYEGALSGVEGHVDFFDALEVTPEEVDQFDQRFPQKETCYQPSQADYAIG